MVDDSQKEDIAESYLTDLRSEYLNNLDHKSSLDNKANSMITISATSTTLLIGITTFLTSKIQSSQICLSFFVLLLSLAIIASVLAIFFSFKSYKLKGYKYAIKYKPFFDENDKYKTDKIEEIRKISKREFTEHRVQDYLLCVKNNTEKSNKKANDIVRGQICFIISVSLFSVFLITVLISIIIHTVVITHF